MTNKPKTPPAFTLVELMVATSIMVIAVGMSSRLFIYAIRSTRAADSQQVLDMQCQTAMENLKTDVRLSAIDKMCFYSPTGNSNIFTGVSWPIPADSNNDGEVDLDSSNHIIWGSTVVYHVWPGSPTELRRTRFTNHTSLTPAQRMTQLTATVAAGYGSGTLEGSSATTDVLFANLFNWSVTPVGGRADGYASAVTLKSQQYLGMVQVTNGVRQITFTVIGKATNSTGYNVGIDSIQLTASHSVLEAETQTLVSVSSGATVSNVDMSAYGSWGGNAQLLMTANTTGKSFTISFNNDQWQDVDFGSVSLVSNTAVIWDSASTDYVVRLDPVGYYYRWFSYEQAGTVYWNTNGDFTNCFIRVLVRGASIESGNWIHADGQKLQVVFYSWDNQMFIQKACIGIFSNTPSGAPAPNMTSNNSTNGVAGSNNVTQLVFTNGFGMIGSFDYNDWQDIKVEKERSYVVTFLVGSNTFGQSGAGHVYQWFPTNGTPVTNSWIWRVTNSAVMMTNYPAISNVLTNVAWSTNTFLAINPTNITPTNQFMCTPAVLGVYGFWMYEPSNGMFVSQHFDTQDGNPGYTSMSWNVSRPAGTALSMYFRNAGTESNLDLASWTFVSSNSPGSISGTGEWCQYQALFQADSACQTSALLRDVTVKWPGDIKDNDVTLSYTKGPNYGVFDVKVDSNSLVRALTMSLSIYDSAQVFQGTNRTITSSLTAEVEPRNSYKGQ